MTNSLLRALTARSTGKYVTTLVAASRVLPTGAVLEMARSPVYYLAHELESAAFVGGCAVTAALDP